MTMIVVALALLAMAPVAAQSGGGGQSGSDGFEVYICITVTVGILITVAVVAIVYYGARSLKASTDTLAAQRALKKAGGLEEDDSVYDEELGVDWMFDRKIRDEDEEVITGYPEAEDYLQDEIPGRGITGANDGEGLIPTIEQVVTELVNGQISNMRLPPGGGEVELDEEVAPPEVDPEQDHIVPGDGFETLIGQLRNENITLQEKIDLVKDSYATGRITGDQMDTICSRLQREMNGVPPPPPWWEKLTYDQKIDLARAKFESGQINEEQFIAIVTHLGGKGDYQGDFRPGAPLPLVPDEHYPTGFLHLDMVGKRRGRKTLQRVRIDVPVDRMETLRRVYGRIPDEDILREMIMEVTDPILRAETPEAVPPEEGLRSEEDTMEEGVRPEVRKVRVPEEEQD
jgi:hypothetical protein